MGDYADQAWFKAMYTAESIEDVENFLTMVGKGEDHRKEELQPYRDYMTRGFEGQVCERIYESLKELL
jgi:hypothetical protein